MGLWMRMAFSASIEQIRSSRNYFYFLISQLLGIRILQLNGRLFEVIAYKLKGFVLFHCAQYLLEHVGILIKLS